MFYTKSCRKLLYTYIILYQIVNTNKRTPFSSEIELCNSNILNLTMISITTTCTHPCQTSTYYAQYIILTTYTFSQTRQN